MLFCIVIFEGKQNSGVFFKKIVRDYIEGIYEKSIKDVDEIGNFLGKYKLPADTNKNNSELWLV